MIDRKIRAPFGEFERFFIYIIIGGEIAIGADLVGLCSTKLESKMLINLGGGHGILHDVCCDRMRFPQNSSKRETLRILYR